MSLALVTVTSSRLFALNALRAGSLRTARVAVASSLFWVWLALGVPHPDPAWSIPERGEDLSPLEIPSGHRLRGPLPADLLPPADPREVGLQGQLAGVPDPGLGGLEAVSQATQPPDLFEGLESAPLRLLSGFFLLRPVDGRVSSRFGPRLHPILGVWRQHNGVDLAAPTGTPVLAAAPGEVIFAGWRGGYGLAVELRHDDVFSTLYAHLDSVSVPVGAVLGRGDVLGLVGETGLATGPHLHLELRQANVPIDPELAAPYLF